MAYLFYTHGDILYENFRYVSTKFSLLDGRVELEAYVFQP